MNTFIELRQEDDYQEIFHEGTGLISQVFDIYESFSDLGEIRVWLRADFQSGSRVLKKVF